VEVVVHLDTNAYSAFVRGEPNAVFIIEHAPSLVLSPIVIGELKCGFALGTRAQRNLEQLREFQESPRVVVPSIDDEVTSSYARIFKQLRRDGRPLPTNDLWIAAFLRVGKEEALLTLDEHFSFIDGLVLIHTKEDFLKRLNA
jgi:predicted nucleic acid-binding protein